MDSNLFGEKVKPDPKRCGHANWTGEIPVHGTIKLRSTYEPGKDEVVEVGRRIASSGQFHGTCLDCGYQLYFGASKPKYLLRRLARLRGVFKTGEGGFGEELADPGKPVEK